MYKHTLIALGIAGSALGALGLPLTACAATDDDLKELREQVRQMKESYEKRIQSLEKRLLQTEQPVGQPRSPAPRADAISSQSPVQASSRQAAENAFNPGISLILNGTYGNLKRDPAGYKIGGFAPTQGEVAPPNRGLSLGESELVMSANIDSYFRGTLIAAIAPDDAIAIEEGYLQTLGLSNGFTVKAGRFFSGIGYQNEVHAHAWDFTDGSLASRVFLGGRLAEDGIQVKWVAPTDLYVDVGVEAGRGRKFPASPDGGRSKNGFGSGTAFSHIGGDIGASTAWRIGLSHLRTSPQDRTYADADAAGIGVTNGFTGKSRLWVVDGVLKWAPNGNATQTSFKLQGEYFRRNESGTLTYDTTAASSGTQNGGYASRQSGFYVQGVYQFIPRWRAGYRYDHLSAGTTSIGLVNSGALSSADFPILNAYNPTRNTFMVDWSPSEFSRLRLQFARDRSQSGIADNQVFLQYIMSLGAHGAHKF